VKENSEDRRKGPAELDVELTSAGSARRKPEIMSPAGHWPEMHAAVEAGADAVYFGLRHFSARAKVGFETDELPEIMRFLHRRGVKGYVTFNTLVFQHELSQAAVALAAIARAGVDAIIVQDVGVLRLARRLAPQLPLHGSTQMSLTSAEGVEWAASLGASRVVLGRELSLKDLRAIAAATQVELEVFVHGALCVSYSGQCFSSEAWGGRSANRGQCAQACRLPYEMEVDGVVKPLGAARYLLSPGDLHAVEQVPELVELGIASLKIEGRYKGPEYVALTTQAYRQAVDAAWGGEATTQAAPVVKTQLEQVYSRGLDPHFIAGTNHQTVVEGRAPRHRGVLVGKVAEVLGERVLVDPVLADSVSGADATALKAGDGLVFDAADWRSPEEKEEGGRIYEIEARDDGLLLAFGNRALDFGRIRAGDRIWRSHDPAIDKAARPYLKPASPVARQAVALKVTACEGKPLRLHWSLVQNPEIEVEIVAEEPLAAARNRVLDADYLRQQCGRLGDTPYVLAGLELSCSGRPFVPASRLGAWRRQAVAALVALQERPVKFEVDDPDRALAETLGTTTAKTEPLTVSQPHLHLLVRTPQQLEAALGLEPASITLDYLDLYGLRPAVDLIAEAGICVRVASPRVLKPAEQKVLRFLLKLGCPILVRSSGLLHALNDETERPDLIGDFSLNAANTLAASTYLGMGLSRLTPSYDLNAAQITQLALDVGPQHLEVALYQHLPVFHTEHCVFCRFLSKGTSYRDCGKPCESHQLALKDRNGMAHPVMADVGCRNTVFGAQAQEASAHLAKWTVVGLRHFRLEFAHETGTEVIGVTQAYRAALAGELGADQLRRRVEAAAPQGRGEGSLFVAADYLNIPSLG
jgi:U32 family peptidase